jgi:hypothetical protein
LPNVFLFIPAKFRTLIDRPLSAAVPDFSAFLVLHRVLETAIDHILVHLGTANLVAATYKEDLGLFAAHQ